MVDFLTVIVVVYIVGIIGIGVYVGRKNKATASRESFFLADKSEGVGSLSVGFLAALVSGVSFIGYAGLVYSMGAWMAIYSNIAVMAVGLISAFYLVKPFQRAGSVSFGGYAHEIFNGQSTRVVFGLVLALAGWLYVIAQMKAGGLVAQFVLGISKPAAIIIIGTALLIYVTIGGMYAIKTTDLIQGIIMLIVMLGAGILILTTQGFDVLEQATTRSPEFSQLNITYLSAFCYFLAYVTGIAVFPTTLLHLFAARDAETARDGTLWAMLGYAAFHICVSIIIVAGAIVLVGPLDQFGIENPDFIIFYVLDEIFPTVILGITLAGTLAAIMSSTDGLLFNAANSLVNDIYTPIKQKYRDETPSQKETIRLTIASIWILGIMDMYIAIQPLPLIGIIAGQVLGFAGAGLFIPLVIGTWWDGATKQGATAAPIAGIVVYAIAFFLNIGPQLGINLFFPIVPGIIVNLLVFVGVSKRTNTDPDRLQAVHRIRGIDSEQTTQMED